MKDGLSTLIDTFPQTYFPTINPLYFQSMKKLLCYILKGYFTFKKSVCCTESIFGPTIHYIIPNCIPLNIYPNPSNIFY